MEKVAAEIYIARNFVIFIAYRTSFRLQAKENELDRTYHA